MIQGIYRLNGRKVLAEKGLSRGEGRSSEYYIPELDKWVNAKRIKIYLSRINMSVQEYYDKYVLDIHDHNDRPKCPYCGKECVFIEIGKGYRTTCGDPECISKEYTSCQKYSRENNPDRWKRQSETVKKLYRNKDYYESWYNSRKEKFNTPEYRKQLSDTSKKNWQNPTEAMLSTLGTGYHKSWVYSPYENKDIHLDSSWEQKFFSDIQLDKTVVSVIRPRIPIKYVSPEDNETHSYFPDFLVEYKDGRKELIEIKPEYKLSNEVVLSKIKAAEEFCKNLDNTVYKVLSESNYKF